MVERNQVRSFDARLLEPSGRMLPPTEFRASDRELLQVAISCIDLTSLAGSETTEDIRRLCRKAMENSVAAVCVYARHVETAAQELEGSDVHVAAVTAGFPIADSPVAKRVKSVAEALSAGADEIEVVINRPAALDGRWEELYEELVALRLASGDALLKVILATGDLREPERISRASTTAMMAGADFIKTSTGRETVNATLEAGEVIASAISDYADRTGYRIGIKPAGGIRTAGQAIEWVLLVKNCLGAEWLDPRLFRIGASSLLDGIRMRLSEHPD